MRSIEAPLPHLGDAVQQRQLVLDLSRLRDLLDSAADYRRYIARMRDIPRYFDEQIVNMRAGLARGFSVPRATLAGRDASIASFADRNVVENPFYAAFKNMPSIIPAARAAGAAR